MQFDLFFLWRRILVIACTLYAVIRLAQSAMLWYGRLTGPSRYTSMARQYLLVQLLRISPRRFIWEIMDIALLAALAGTLIWLHRHVSA
ncbi:MAG: hypothetical protein BIFFINMI_02851 [Phycisphaerae bacterium]|nr:hypothetical protein [Phycisphaerae bacterium]